MKAVFLTEGGKRFGLGHIVRCAGIQEAFEEKGIASEFIVNADDTVAGVLSNANYRACDWVNEKEKALETIGKDDVVIVDSYVADPGFYKEISKKAWKSVYLDDHRRINYPEGIVINSAIYARELDYPRDNGNVYLLGPEYISLRKEFWDISDKKRAAGGREILITFGGMDHSGLIQRIVDYLNEKSRYTFHCIDSNKNKMDPANFLQWILESDICISGGGQTVYNLARCGLPTIGVCLSDNQLLNLRSWGKTKFLEFIGDCKDNDLLVKLERFLGAPEFGEFLGRGSIGRQYIDGQGARRVVQAVLSEIG